MKRKITLALLLALMLTLVGCNGCSGDSTSDPTASAPTENSAPVTSGTENTDDGVIDLDAPQGDSTTTTTTTKAESDATKSEGTDTVTTTVPTAGDFDDPSNFIEVPLG